ncbi:MAG: hypothetical protein U0800_02540 [Isosphaeraceae bacterium]
MRPPRSGPFPLIPCLAFALLSADSAGGQESPRGASIRATDGKVWAGKVVGDRAGGFRFQAEAPGPTLALDRAGLVKFAPAVTTEPDTPPPFRVLLGHDQVVSGRGPSVDDGSVRLEVGPGGRPLVADRAGVLAIRQRPNEAAILLEGFEAWDEAAWAREGDLALDESDRREGARSLLIPPSPGRLTHKLPAPVASGRVELAFRQDPRRAQGRRWYVELEFRGAEGPPQPVRIVPGWAEESPGVETPEGPSLAIQRLMIAEGWHTLSVVFGGDTLEMTIDRNVLAHGKGPVGELVAVRLVSDAKGIEAAPAGLSARVDDLRIVRSLDDSKSQEGDRTIDEMRLVSGDQLFGKIRGADTRGASIEVLGRVIECPWTDLVALGFRRAAVESRPLEGQQARITWSAGDERHPDAAEGVLMAMTDRSFELATPFAGVLSIPAERVRSIQGLGRGSRLVIDPTPHHLGDQFMPRFSPPQPEGGVLERAFRLEKAPATPAFLVLDVIEVAGAADNLDFAPFLKNGELRTNLSINGREFEYLNKYVLDRNEVAARVRIPIPEGLLKAGENRVRFDQVGKKSDPGFLDDLEVLTVAVEVPSPGEGAP